AITEKDKASVKIWIEAEDGKIDAPMRILERNSASGGQFIESFGNSTQVPPSQGYAVYTYNIHVAGTYKIWGRVIADMADEDSFWIRMDDGEWVMWENIEVGCNWHWDEVHDYENNYEVMKYELDAGLHTLTVTYCIDQTRLDKILITNDLEYVPTTLGPHIAPEFIFSPEAPISNEPIAFDGSASTSNKGKIKRYSWEFGAEAGSNKKRTNYTFAEAGTYPATLIVEDSRGLTSRITKNITVYTDKPVARFKHSPGRTRPNESVLFDASESLDADGDIVSFEWDLGDGSRASGQTHQHAYNNVGEYTATLTVTDNDDNKGEAVSLVTVIGPTPKKIIYETDMCLDVDDVGGLAMLHALADNGEVELLAVGFNEVHPGGAGTIDAINTWYGRGDIPIGVYKKELSAPDYSAYLDAIANYYPDLLQTKDAPSAVDIYRDVLSKQPDKSVTIVSVGFLNNLSDVLDAEPELIAKKVDKLVLMGGIHNGGFNFSRHELTPATHNVIENWPSHVVISSAGGNIFTGPDLELTPIENPVREAYYQFFNSNFCKRPSWDQIAILYGVRGLSDYFEEVTTGEGYLRDSYRWNMMPEYRTYLRTNYPPEYYARLIEDLMIAPPALK
ncbi:PKD domain-containing protein, partial [Candidatus Neomarinimicrobiota bacterium]